MNDITVGREMLQRMINAIDMLIPTLPGLRDKGSVWLRDEIIKSADELRAALAEPVVTENLTTEYDQTALELCNVCGWKAVIPTEGCLSCEREKQLMKKPPAEPAVEPVAEVAWDGVNPNVSFIKFLPTGAGLPVGTKLYTSPPPPAKRPLTDDAIEQLIRD